MLTLCVDQGATAPHMTVNVPLTCDVVDTHLSSILWRLFGRESGLQVGLGCMLVVVKSLLSLLSLSCVYPQSVANVTCKVFTRRAPRIASEHAALAAYLALYHQCLRLPWRSHWLSGQCSACSCADRSDGRGTAQYSEELEQPLRLLWKYFRRTPARKVAASWAFCWAVACKRRALENAIAGSRST